jgi:uncharacterized protein
MKTLGWLLILILMVLIGGVGHPDCAKAAPVHIRFASHVIGGTAYTQAALIAQQLRPLLPEGSTIDVLPYSGGIGNIKLIEDGKADLGTNLSASDRWAVDGKVIFDKKYKKLRHVATTDVFYFCAYATEKSGITSLEESFKAKKPIRWLALEKGATGEVTTRLVLEAYGVTPDKLKEWGGSFNYSGWVNIAPTLKDARGDIVSHGVGIGHPSMSEVAVTVPGRFLDLKESVREFVAKEYGIDKADLPANSFTNQPKPVKTVAYYLTIVASADLSEDLVYQIAKVLTEKREELIKGHKSFMAVPPELSCQPGKYGAPLHRGAERYYRERGWIK